MSAIVVQVCRADTADQLQLVIGSALAYWGASGFTKINVEYVAPGDDMAGVYLKTAATGVPQQLWKQLAEDYTAVLVLTKPA